MKYNFEDYMKQINKEWIYLTITIVLGISIGIILGYLNSIGI